MALTHLAQDRIRIALFWLAVLQERHKDTARHITASMIVPRVTGVLKIQESSAFGYIRQAHALGYIEDDTDIASGPNRRSKPIKITDLGRRVLGAWNDTALAQGAKMRAEDDATPPPLPLEQAG